MSEGEKKSFDQKNKTASEESYSQSRNEEQSEMQDFAELNSEKM